MSIKEDLIRAIENTRYTVETENRNLYAGDFEKMVMRNHLIIMKTLKVLLDERRIVDHQLRNSEQMVELMKNVLEAKDERKD